MIVKMLLTIISQSDKISNKYYETKEGQYESHSD